MSQQLLAVDINGWAVTWQIMFEGMVRGLGYAVLAAGLVLIYRSSGVVNFAQGAFGAFGVNLFALLAVEHGINYWLAMTAGIIGSVAIAVVTELVVVRRLFDASRVVLFIATVGVAQIILSVINLAMPDVFGAIPIAFDSEWATMQPIEGLRIGANQFSAVVLIIPLLLALGVFLTRTRFGLHIRGVADSPENARLVGVSPRRVSTIVWGLAGGFAAISQIIVSPAVGVRTVQDLSSVSSVGLLLRALLVALAARMKSMPLVVIAGILVGVGESTIIANLNAINPSITDLFILIAVLLLVLFRARGAADDEGALSVGVKVPPIPQHLRSIWWVRWMPQMGLGILLAFFLIVPPLMWNKSSELNTWTQVMLFSAIAISLSLLTGWAGQLSLGQMAFAGVGGMATVALSQGHTIGIGLPGWTWFDFSVNLPWLIALAAGTAVGVFFAVLIGVPSLRVQGLFLAVTTLAFAAMTANWMLRQDGWSAGATSATDTRQPRPDLFGIDFTPPRNYYFLCLAFLTIVVLVVAQIRRTGIGRTIIAVRDNEQMTAAATVSPTRAKLTAFAVAGGIAAMAGGLLVFLLPGFNIVGPDRPFAAEESLHLVAIAIIGGIGSIAGGILGALWVIGVPALFPDWDAIELLTADIGLLVLLLYFPGGFVQIIYNARQAMLRWVERHYDLDPVTNVTRVTTIPTRDRVVDLPAEGEPWLSTEGVTVRFGGLVAVDDVTLEVGKGELIGLIGTNGAGKSTLMNAISGFIPSTGSIHVLGKQVDRYGSARRHALGLGRGFQDASLFPALTVRETILVALEARERSLLFPSMAHVPPSPGSERRKSSEASEILGFLGLGGFQDTFVSDLSTGTRRIVELACLIATDAKVLLLDEPTGGVAQKETEAFAPLIKRVQAELGASVLLIEHDMPLVMSISDRVYCLEAGAVIAQGVPAEVRDNPVVIASYLGTDDRAIQRSNQDS